MTKQSAFCRTTVVLAAVAVVAMGGCGGSGSGSSTPPPPTPDFSLTAPSGAVSVAQGASGTSTVTAAVSGGFNAPIALTATGQPTGVTIGFSPATIPAPGSGSSTVTITVGAAVATGNYTITVTGTGDSITHTATVALTVTSASTPDFTLTVPSTALSVAQGASGTSTATTAVSGGFSAPIALVASGLPAGVYIGFSQTTFAAPGTGSSTLTIAVGPAVATGNYSITITGTGGSVTHTATVALTVTSATALSGTPLLVGYLPDYQGNYATFATSLDFNKMTDLVLAFGLPASCGGTCTASSSMTWSLQQSDADIATLVSAAHAAGVKVLLSIGGGDPASDARIEGFYKVGLSTQLVASLDSYLTAHNLDGVDVDIEDPGNMGTNYDTFVTALTTKLHSDSPSKKTSVAVATWIWQSPPYPDTYGAPMANSTLQQYDIVGVMAYSFLGYDTTAAQYYSDTQMSMQYFANLGVPNSKMTVGVPFYAQNASGSISETYATIIGAYPNAPQTNEVSGGSLDGGATLYYMGDALMAQETQLGAEQYGGVMIWELSQDAPTPNSLLTVIQNNQ